MDPREGGLLAWQWRGYPLAHADRRNLMLHVLTQPLFVLGCVGVVVALAGGPWQAASAGLVGIAVAAAAQGRGHRLEREPPAPFRGPLDVVTRLFVEQWVTFPRFVLSGGLAR